MYSWWFSSYLGKRSSPHTKSSSIQVRGDSDCKTWFLWYEWIDLIETHGRQMHEGLTSSPEDANYLSSDECLRYHRIVKYPYLEGNHKGHGVQLPTPHRITSQILCLRALSKCFLSSSNSGLCLLPWEACSMLSTLWCRTFTLYPTWCSPFKMCHSVISL